MEYLVIIEAYMHDSGIYKNEAKLKFVFIISQISFHY